ncbi:uncharacterized protein Z518_08907 [Rhinocladiella mackenziei CBS 650.93]|uniref:Azaphilone pigments biosynthesis cluster protein L N-terminal domain-containing protein n=1 Tax=Rhinocladiella mackenziei CBS 650.93 TaxID=1442369 RepID=A0A0D2FGP7_9EURO|nr:uncharacterized protein Z518_08907 [Rhinocladiella mackenziei CBS 650.93]KIX01182.1 hypothetical protein Z518_08907 [Rhinocladiella mackenziei CBS 650.93]
MAEALGTTPTILPIIYRVTKSVVAASAAIKGLRAHYKIIRDVWDELIGLEAVLLSLREASESDPAIISLLAFALERCGQECKEFSSLIQKCTVHSGGSRPSIRDWATLKYIGSDISGFLRMLTGYKMTIYIALETVNIRGPQVGVEHVQLYQKMISANVKTLEERLTEVNGKLESLDPENNSYIISDTAERRQMLEERASLQLLIDVCLTASQYPEIRQPDIVNTERGLHESEHLPPAKQATTRTLNNGEITKMLLPSEYDGELASVHSVDSPGTTATGSSTTLVGEVLAAANEFVSLLLEDQTLTPLFSTAFDRIKADKLERNIKRLLKKYAIDLRQEAKGDVEKKAVQLIQKRARYIAYRVRLHYDKSTVDKAVWFEQLTKMSSDKRALMEDYLRGRTDKSTESLQRKPHGDDDNDGDASDSSISTEAEADQPELNDLDRVKLFMFESAAYQRFRQNLKDFVLPRRELEQQNATSSSLLSFLSLEIWGKLQVKCAEVIHALLILSRPVVPSGHKRITWICVS